MESRTRARRKEVTRGKLKKRRDLLVKKEESRRVNVKMSRSGVRGSKSLARLHSPSGLATHLSPSPLLLHLRPPPRPGRRGGAPPHHQHTHHKHPPLTTNFIHQRHHLQPPPHIARPTRQGQARASGPPRDLSLSVDPLFLMPLLLLLFCASLLMPSLNCCCLCFLNMLLLALNPLCCFSLPSALCDSSLNSHFCCSFSFSQPATAALFLPTPLAAVFFSEPELLLLLFSLYFLQNSINC
ncbi:hypothetical protein VPH35_096630 [Triticum aestivum]